MVSAMKRDVIVMLHNIMCMIEFAACSCLA